MKETLYALFMALLGYLLLPKKAGLPGIRAWAHRASYAILATIGILLGAISAAYGLVPGIPGFITEDRIKSVEDHIAANDATLKVLARTTIRPDIYQLRQLQCKATDEKLRVSLAIELRRDLDDYRERVGTDLILPACGEF
jgi:hypothetical protein